jgi:hypothetical protein
MMCRSEWHERLYVDSRTTFTSQSIDPTLIAKDPPGKNVSTVSYYRNASTTKEA